jgi:hypothetical protein
MRRQAGSFAADDMSQDLAEYSLLIVLALTAIVGLVLIFHPSAFAVVNVPNPQLLAAQCAI